MEGLDFGNVLFSSEDARVGIFSGGAFGAPGRVKSGLPPALLFSTASSLENASREEVGLRIKSSSKESSMKVVGVPALLAAWAVSRDKSSLV